jgi:hypothetical protein
VTYGHLPNFPQLLKGRLILVDPESGIIVCIIVLQYNPDSLLRTLQVQVSADVGQDLSQALRIKTSPVETFKFDADTGCSPLMRHHRTHLHTSKLKTLPIRESLHHATIVLYNNCYCL